MLKTDHWLSDRRNILHLVLHQQSWAGGTGVSQETQNRPMSLWTCTELLTFLTKEDVQGPASVLFANGVNGEDLRTMTETTLVQELRLSPFAARKILRARDVFVAAC